MHPALVRIRGRVDEEVVRRFARKFKGVVEDAENGFDVYFNDVNDARFFLSRLKKIVRGTVNMSTKYRGGKVFFVYSFRPSTMK